jgi:hypothetical protein
MRTLHTATSMARAFAGHAMAQAPDRGCELSRDPGLSARAALRLLTEQAAARPVEAAARSVEARWDEEGRPLVWRFGNSPERMEGSERISDSPATLATI